VTLGLDHCGEGDRHSVVDDVIYLTDKSDTSDAWLSKSCERPYALVPRSTKRIPAHSRGPIAQSGRAEKYGFDSH